MLRLLTLLLVTSACSGAGSAGEQAQPESTEAEAESGESTVGESATAEAPPMGTVRGVVRFEGELVPRYTLEQISAGPGVTERSPCGPPQASARTPVVLTEAGTLSGVVVTASGTSSAQNEALTAVPHEPQNHQLQIDDCILEPRTLDATLGDTITVTNNSSEVFVPMIGAVGGGTVVAEGASTELEVNMVPVGIVRCGIGAACGRTDVVVHQHGVHTTTNESGAFEFEVPEGDFTINAWHPLLQYSSAPVTVVAGETAEVEITLTAGVVAE